MGFTDLLNKIKTAKKVAGKAVKSAKTKVEKRQAKSLLKKAEREESEIKRYESQLERLKKQEKHASTKRQMQKKQKQIDAIRSEVSYKDRVILNIKKNARKSIDKSLKKHGL